jgi:hypothetical protein
VEIDNMIPEWIIKRLTVYGNCYLYASMYKYNIKEIEKIIGKKITTRVAAKCDKCGIILEVVN